MCLVIPPRAERFGAFFVPADRRPRPMPVTVAARRTWRTDSAWPLDSRTSQPRSKPVTRAAWSTSGRTPCCLLCGPHNAHARSKPVTVAAWSTWSTKRCCLLCGPHNALPDRSQLGEQRGACFNDLRYANGITCCLHPKPVPTQRGASGTRRCYAARITPRNKISRAYSP